MKELSIFVDESGDLGEYDYRAPYYIISMVLHDQNYDMNQEADLICSGKHKTCCESHAMSVYR